MGCTIVLDFWQIPFAKCNSATSLMCKDISVGVLDPRSGLTHVTLQRGRLMFNMGRPAADRATARQAADTLDAVEAPPRLSSVRPPVHPTNQKRWPPATHHFHCGAFTGRSLYPEEAYYLLMRDALIVFEMEESERESTLVTDGTISPKRQSLTLTRFLTLLLTSRLVSMPCLDAYAFLKDAKLHPRRHFSSVSPEGRLSLAQYELEDEDTSTPAFDVFQSITETIYEEAPPLTAIEPHQRAVGKPAESSSVLMELGHDTDITGDLATACLPVDAREALPHSKMKKRKVKRLQLMFRIVVCRFNEDAPGPRLLRSIVDDVASRPSEAAERTPAIPVKLAVVQLDRSVLLFDVA